MISRSSTIERLATANDLLLAPFGLTEVDLGKTLGIIGQRQIDDADLYFQYTRAEGWSLEEGIVKTGSFSIDQGVGLRAVSGEKTAFAYSDDISWAALMEAANQVRSIGSSGQSGRVRVGRQKQVQPPAPARKKLGFPVPVRDWLRQEPYTSRVRAVFSRPAATEFFDPRALHSMLNQHLHGGDCWRQIWCVYSFLIWYEQFFGA